MGSAVAAHAARRGKRVLGVERFALGHDLGASSGRTRIIRKAYFEAPAYVPLLERAYELWTALERETGTVLVDRCGVLVVGSATSLALAGVRRSAAQFAIDVEEYSAAKMHERWPQCRPLSAEAGLFERDAGVVFPERGIAAHQRIAIAHGAELRAHTEVAAWSRRAGGALELQFRGGARIETERLALCAGPWMGSLTGELALPIVVQRNVQLWFGAPAAQLGERRMPAFFVDRAGFPKPLYGTPDYGDGLKAALHGFGDRVEPDALDRAIAPEDIDAVARALDAWLPGAAATYREGKACMYALTPDEHFIIDLDPRDAGIVIAGGFSGHGYKFAPVFGEIVAGLALDGAARHPIDFLSLKRFTSRRPPL